jgi:hypothetical protein
VTLGDLQLPTCTPSHELAHEYLAHECLLPQLAPCSMINIGAAGDLHERQNNDLSPTQWQFIQVLLTKVS